MPKTKPIYSITEEEYRDYADSYAGYCIACRCVTNDSGVEPDAEGYPCDECGLPRVMGVEQALMMGRITLND